jgi:ferredoxin
MKGYTLRVDPIGCDGHGMCADLLPELITLDDWGYAIVATTDVPPDLVRAAKRAATSCPKLALVLTRTSLPTPRTRARVPARTVTHETR